MKNVTITAETAETLLQWSAPQRFTNGKAEYRTAEPTGEFWSLWRSQKAAFQALKIHPKLLQPENKWIVNWFRDLTAAPAPAPVSVSSSPVKKEVRWSDEQQAIFGWFRTGTGSLVVMARAGTGKTTTIKQAFTYAPEEAMLYAVFNKKNQIEAAEAISDPRVEIKTLHSVGFMFIQQVWPNSKPDDSVETDRIQNLLGDAAPKEVKTQVRKLVGFAKNTLVNPSLEELVSLAEDRSIECPQFELEENGGWSRTKLAAVTLEVLAASKIQDRQGRISFNDMVWLPVAMNWVRAWYDLVVVDEAQDMNLPQLLMAKACMKPGGRVCVVGDDRQAIYNFRGAASDGMTMMKNSLSAIQLGLTTTYRCPKSVVAMAAAIVPDYRAADTAPEGTVSHSTMITLESDLKIGDAVLSRANAPLMPVCLSLLRKGTPARIEGRDLGKALIELVEKLNARTVPQFLTKVEAWGTKQTARFSNTKNFEDKAAEINDQVATLTAIAEGASSVREIISRISSVFQDSGTGSKPAVVLSTVHKAKGLEWNKVFILSETFNRRRPKNAAPISPEQAEKQAKEEANVYYVALTRAKQELVLVSSR